MVVPDSLDARASIEVITALRAAGFSAFLVGGCVRDLVLGLEPKDYDVATNARPDEVLALFDRVIEVGVAFGVVRVLRRCGGELQEIEVATYRADGAYIDGRRPTEVRFTDAREDVLRRDFSLNGLLLDPVPGAGGRVIDWVGGIADLEQGHLRAIGQPAERFSEDALRLLRAVRFAARFGLHIERHTAAAITELRSGLGQISRERVHVELVGMLRAPHAGEAVRLLARLRLVEALWPSLLERDPGLLRTERRMRALCDGVHWAVHEDGGQREQPGLSPVIDLPFPLALAGFMWSLRLADSSLPDEVAASLRLSLAQSKRLRTIWTIASQLLHSLVAGRLPAVRADDARLARLLRQPEADAALRLLLAEADNVPEGWPHSARTWLRALRRLRLKTPAAQWRPKPFVTGSALKALGFAPSARFRPALQAAETVQLEGGSAAEALAAATACLTSDDEATADLSAP